MEALTPIVRWAQNGPRIDLTVELSDVKEPVIELNEQALTFQGFGCGAQGKNIYNFKLEFFSKIDYKGSSYKVSDRNVSFQVYKQVQTEEWPRLLKNERKPGWLRIDFDKWKVEDSEEENEDSQEQINKISFEQRIKSEVEKAKDDIKIYTKISWLTIYNLLQALCFSIILGKLIFNIVTYQTDAPIYAYDDVSDLLLTCQLAAHIEILNPLFGIVKTGVIAPFMQVCGRNFVLFVLIVPEKTIHHDPVMLTLLLAWAVIEVIRYPFYLLTLHRYNVWLISWLRYSAWLILYPVGFTSEAILMYRSISLADEKKRLEYALPNSLNISFSLATFLKFYLCVYAPLCVYLLKHMWILRQRKLGGKKPKAKQQ